MAQDSASMNPSMLFPTTPSSHGLANDLALTAGEPTGPKVDVPPTNEQQTAGQDAGAPKVKTEKERESSIAVNDPTPQPPFANHHAGS